MSIFNNNITSEHPMTPAFKFVKDFIDMYFDNIVTSAGWKVEEAEEVINQQFRKKIVFFEQFGLQPPHILITHDSVTYWKVIVLTSYTDKDGSLILYNSMIEKDYKSALDWLEANPENLLYPYTK